MQGNQRQADWEYISGIMDGDGYFITSDLGFCKYKLDRTLIRQSKDDKRFGSKPIYDWYIRKKRKALSEKELNYLEDMYLKMHKFGDNKAAATTKSPSFERRSDSLNS